VADSERVAATPSPCARGPASRGPSRCPTSV
jgi:hypothetical protein